MLGTDHISTSLGVATVVVPVAFYFLLLGLLNSRGHPQILSGRRDFALLTVALCPIFALPVLNWMGVSVLTVVSTVAVVAAGVWAMAPRGRSWVIYNLSQARARDAVARALDQACCEYRATKNGFVTSDGAKVELSGFSLLQNVTVKMLDADAVTAGRFARALESQLSRIRVQASPMAVTMLLVATAMLVAPLTLVAHRAGEIVRILTDLLQ